VADLTTANANVYYALGIRHTIKPYTTVCLMSSKTKLEFDLNFSRAYPYTVDDDGHIIDVDKHIEAITIKLETAKSQKSTDSPVHQLVEGIHFENSLAHEKTDIFRDKVIYESTVKEALADIRNHSNKTERLSLLQRYMEDIQPLANQETGVLIDVLLTYRAIGTWAEMVAYAEALPEYVFHTQMVQEQYGFALNRNKQPLKAISILDRLITKSGANPETNGILVRVYKDLSDSHKGQNIKYNAYLQKAKETYLSGFESGMRDAYPGVNAVTLMVLTNDDRYHKLVAVVEMAVMQKIKQKTPDYWDYATLFELALIVDDLERAEMWITKALACPIEDWMTESTKNNSIKLLEHLPESNKDVYLCFFK